MTNIIEGLPYEIIAIVLQYHLYPTPSMQTNKIIERIEYVLNGPFRKSIIDAHTTINITTNADGYKFMRYVFNKELHREDGPAYERYYANGNINHRGWYINGKLHREDGPAYETYCANGNINNRYWYING